MRVLVYGDSNSWGCPPDGCGLRFDAATRWPCVMAAGLGAQVIEDALPGRTTVHDDPELHGATMNGLKALPGALLAHSPLDLVIIMLGTNDCKARFHPTAAGIADNIGRLLDCVGDIGGGRGPWDEGDVPAVVVVVPPPLAQMADRPEFERQQEWLGGRAASLGLAECVHKVAKARGVSVFEAGGVVSHTDIDPIHFDGDSHKVLGRALASWVLKLNGHGETAFFDVG